MTTPSRTLSELNKVVVALLTGPRLKGYVYNFSPLRDAFHVLPPEDPLKQRGTEVKIKDVKAIFFVTDFSGKCEDKPSPLVGGVPQNGRKIEVTCGDGETLVGVTVAYNPQKLGFFMFPLDSESNNLRIFVINKNARGVRFL
jgi:hypothetical protein